MSASEVTLATYPPHQAGEGGAIPTPTLCFTFVENCLSEVKELISRYHYSRRARSCPVYHAGLVASGCGQVPTVVAGIVFTETTARSWSGKAWELQRLVRHPDYRPPLTSLIGRSVRAIRRISGHPGVLVSYADATYGHHGGVYQAANWNYGGFRNPCMDGLVVDGLFVPGRSCNSRWGTRSPKKLAKKFPHLDIVPHYDEGKHLYWLRIGKDELFLRTLPYPKPDRPPQSMVQEYAWHVPMNEDEKHSYPLRRKENNAPTTPAQTS